MMEVGYFIFILKYIFLVYEKFHLWKYYSYFIIPIIWYYPRAVHVCRHEGWKKIMKNIRNTCDKTNVTRLQLLYRLQFDTPRRITYKFPMYIFFLRKQCFSRIQWECHDIVSLPHLRNRWLAIVFGIRKMPESLAAPPTWDEY